MLFCRLGRSPVSFVLGLRIPGVYSIPCECGQIYIGQTGRSIETRIKELHLHILLGHLVKSAVAELRFNRKHVIKFQDNLILLIVSGYVERLIREAVGIELNPNNMNREDGLTLNRSRKPLLRLLRESRRPSH